MLMIWWDWSWRQRLAVFIALFAIAAGLTWWGLGGVPDAAAFAGGCAFFAIPLLTGFSYLSDFEQDSRLAAAAGSLVPKSQEVFGSSSVYR